ncbi:pak-box p21-rho-binding protein [Colletotrichum plurivorum]|uniref:Pak-box p21-rho-binding protein n=1 Tax=Colletotrichum plurivorum TaxID=2175906 RepID=A0A8H6KFH1_9PEZI|nr:pak-box p21-rho-binding protein [Colletotrichum plurivorum]
MWATAPLPYYSAYKPARRKDRASTTVGNKDAAPPTSVVNNPVPVPLPPLSTTQPEINNSNLSDFFEPALDGPPSPERIRALSKQMKRASAWDKHKSNATTSSGSSSSLRSITSERRPSWEHTLENITLSRKSSGRSTSSSMPSRDRPESVQLFGKTIFNRRAKLRRDSSAQSSSNSSLYSGELALDGSASANKDHVIPSIFSRRRTLRQDTIGDDPALGRKLQISGPYNFQHVTHTRRDHLPDLQRGSRAELVSEFSAIRAGQRPTTGSLKGIDVEDLHFSNFSSEALQPQQEDAFANETHSELLLNRPPVVARQSGPVSAPRRPLKHTRSQEQLRGSPPRPAPPRPPRSPIDEHAMMAVNPNPPPMPPPGMSSRVSLQQKQEAFEAIETGDAQDRPSTSGSFQLSSSFRSSLGVVEHSAAVPEFLTHEPDLEVFADPRFSHAITTPDDAAWPLTASSTSFSYEMALPDVPEEEEHHAMGRLSRASMASTNSSLRGSQSVPVLRQLVQAQAQGEELQRPPSGASDTLGSFDVFGTKTALKEALEEEEVGDVLLHRASWEDDIDYCYEHEVEADCDYAWDRPSLDLVREDVVQTPVDNENVLVAPLSAGLKPASVPRLDIPALSPSSPTSTTNGHEAITPTIPALPVRSNFSHPRMETNYRGQSHLHVRTASHASSFKESHGFTLSPSLLIPGDFRQQMMADADSEAYPPDVARHDNRFSFEAEPTLSMETPGLFARDRASTSTTGSNSSEQTSSTAARHTSTNSTWTALTRYTGSTTFEGWNPKAEGIDHARSFSVDEFPDLGSPKGRKSTMTPLPESEEVLTTSLSTGDMRSIAQRNLASLSRESLPLSRSKDSVKQHRRQRARTTSLSTPPPPGQYALFPPVYSGSRI